MAERPRLTGLVNALVITLGCALALAGVRALTGPRIEANETAAARAALAALAPAGVSLPVPLPELEEGGAFRLCDGSLILRDSAAGYGGPIRFLLGLAAGPAEAGAPAAWSIRALHVVSHQETPGITDFLGERETGWLGRLAGQHAETLPGHDAVSGATITSRALTQRLAAILDDPSAFPGASAAPTPGGCVDE